MPKRVMYLPPLASLIFVRAQVFSSRDRNFFRVLGNYSRKQFLQDRVLDCPRESQTNSCCKGLARATRRLFWSCTIGTGNPFFVLRIGSLGPLKLRKTSRTTAF